MNTRSCTEPGCTDPHKGRGLCNRHLLRLRRTGATASPVKSLADRFWPKVDKRGPDNCWPWTAATNERGYGVMRPEGQRSGPTVKAHRVSAQLAGLDIDGRHVLHSCDNPPCVNPAHLSVGTPADNALDRDTKGRGNRGARNGHAKLTEADVRAIRGRLAKGETHTAIAADFDVSRSRISSIAAGQGWTHVA